MWHEVGEWLWFLARIGLLYVLYRAVQGFLNGVANSLTSLKDIATELRKLNAIREYEVVIKPDPNWPPS